MPDTPERQFVYWWRSQAAAYSLRLNERTAEAIRSIRSLTPPGEYAVHVRRGEKWREMKLYPQEKFFAAVPDNATVFLTTEDPSMLKAARERFGSRLSAVERVRINADISIGNFKNFLDDLARMKR
jgi:hypothetical protein